MYLFSMNQPRVSFFVLYCCGAKTSFITKECQFKKKKKREKPNEEKQKGNIENVFS